MTMFRSVSSEEHFSKGASQSLTAGPEKASVTRNESSWISIFSPFSRPAWRLLQKYLPVRSHTSSLTHWSGETGKSKTDIENSLVANLDNLMPATKRPAGLSVACVHCLHENASLLSTSDTEALKWLTEESLHELGIQNSAGAQAQHLAPVGYLTMARKFLSQVFLNAASLQKDVGLAERGQPQLEAWHADPTASRSTKSWFWSLLWGADDPQNVQSVFSESGRSIDTKSLYCGANCPSNHCHPADRGSVAVTKPTELLCDRTVDETAGLLCVREPANNGGLHKAKPEPLPSRDQPPSVHQHSVVGLITDTRAVLTPEQDHGYSSLEEENANTKQHNMNIVCEKPGQVELDGPGPSQESEGGEGEQPTEDALSEAAGSGEEEKEEGPSLSEPTGGSQTSSLPSVPHCPNKAIAYIMGSPCSDGEDSDSDDDSDWDDGFDSEGSSPASDSEDLDDSDDEDDSDGDGLNAESETLWNSLCQNADPYNPRNFTAPIRTAPKATAAKADSAVSGSPPGPAPPTSCSPSPLQLVEESSSDDSSVDEEENLKLWNSFSCSLDPYSPLNFQAPIRTREPGSSLSKKGRPAGPPVYKNEEAEERLDSGFSEAASTLGPRGSGSGVRPKKVTFVEEVEVFYASSDEDRHGPWEEFARDRCRFQRRVQEADATISYCLAPTFRLLIFQRLHHS